MMDGSGAVAETIALESRVDPAQAPTALDRELLALLLHAASARELGEYSWSTSLVQLPGETEPRPMTVDNFVAALPTFHLEHDFSCVRRETNSPSVSQYIITGKSGIAHGIQYMVTIHVDGRADVYDNRVEVSLETFVPYGASRNGQPLSEQFPLVEQVFHLPGTTNGFPALGDRFLALDGWQSRERHHPAELGLYFRDGIEFVQHHRHKRDEHLQAGCDVQLLPSPDGVGGAYVKLTIQLPHRVFSGIDFSKYEKETPVL